MTKAKLIIAIAVAFLFVSNTFALSTINYSNIDRIDEVAEMSRSAAPAGLKTSRGINNFALSSEFEWTKVYIFFASKDRKYEPKLVESLGYLRKLLSGTDEEKIITETINRPEFTFEDLRVSVLKAEKSIYSKLSGESKWAFDLAKVLLDVVLTASPETSDEFKVYLMYLETMAEQGQEYASEEEIRMLREIAGIAKKDSLSDEDFISVEEKLFEFIKVYTTPM